MPEKINIIFDVNSLQEFGRRIKELTAKYVQTLNQPTQREERLLFEDVPRIEIRPKSISDNKKEMQEKRPKNIGIFSNPAKGKDPKMVEDGGQL